MFRPSTVRPTFWFAAALTLAALVLTACAAGPNPAVGAAPGAAGFWLGLWQGLISPVTFLISLFTDHVRIYEVHNNGNWYDFGFMIGVSAVFSGPASTRAAARRPRPDRRAKS